MKRNREYLILALVIGFIALFLSSREVPASRVTISGVSLEDRRTDVESRLGRPNFNASVTSGTVEYWAKQGEDNLYITYDENSRVRKLTGGVAQIDGTDASAWTPERLALSLGAPDHTFKGREVGGESSHSFSYTHHRLLAERQASKTTFVLFRAPEKN